jgi:hypothetical protein
VQAAQELNYLPNFWARSLRTKRTRMVAAVARDFGSATVARVVAGLLKRLHERAYLLALASLQADGDLATHFQQRGIEGVVAIDQFVPRDLQLPVASVELGSPQVTEPLEQLWLAEAGEWAADAIIGQIENQNISRRLTVKSKRPSACFGIPSSLHAGVMAQESV